VTSRRLQRDRLTYFGYLSTAAYVWGLYGMGPALLLLRDETGMTRTVSSFHSSAMAFGVFLIGVVGATVTKRFGRGNTISLGSAGAGVGISLVAFGPSALFSVAGAFIMGCGGSLLLNGVAAFLIEHHGKLSAQALGEQNGIGVTAGLLSPLALGALVSAGWDWRLALVVGPVLFVVAQTLRGSASSFSSATPAHTDSSGRLPAAYWWGWGTLTLCIGVEFSFVMWAGDVLRDQSDASVSLAAASLTAVAGGMAAGRFCIGALLRRMRVEQLFMASLLLPLVMWVPMWVSHNSTIILLAMLTIGVGLGFHYPLGFNRMLAAAPGHTDRAAARSSLASGLAIGLAPLGLGALADAVGLHSAFIAVPGMLVAAIALTVLRPIHV
jgi:predicted MFS family arabinose efflux permease